MKLILTRDVQDLGRAGELVNVAEGYGRNFLLPRKMAVVADAGVMKSLDKKKKTLEIKGEHVVVEAQEIAARLQEVTVTIKGKSGSGTKLYGSVTSQEIADALAQQHAVKVDRRKIHITDPIKNIGTYEVPVKLHHDVEAIIKVEVITEEGA